jgi:hypothetical protein
MGLIAGGDTSKKKLEELEAKIDAKANVDALLEGGKIKPSLLPSYVDDVVEGYLNNNKFYKTRTGVEGSYTYDNQIESEEGKIYVDLATNIQYRFSGTIFSNISSGVIDDTATNSEITTYSSKKIEQLVSNKTEIDDSSNTETKTLSSKKIKDDFQTKVITDAGDYFSSNTVEGALQELGAELSGLDTLLGGI